MPEGMGYPKGKGILGKIEQGDFSPDVAKRPNDKLEIDANAKVKQGSLGPDHALGKKEKVDPSIFKMANQKDY